MRNRSFWVGLGTLGVFVLGACPQEKPAEKAPTENVDDEGGDDKDGPAKSVYPDGAVNPLAARLCAAIQTAPRQARARCCNQKPGVLLTGECTRTLSAALADGAVTLAEPAVKACEGAIAVTYAGCDWVGAKSRSIPDACQGLVTGTRTEKTSCRSSLECADGLYCHGVSPTQTGTCGPPHPAGGSCGRGADTLGSYLRDVKKQHPECEGFCANGKCRVYAKRGTRCVSNAHCGPGAHCDEAGLCQDQAAGGKDAPCLGGRCEEGLRCVDKTCRAPKATGEVCTADVECLGACLVDGQGPEGVCGMRCGG